MITCAWPSRVFYISGLVAIAATLSIAGAEVAYACGCGGGVGPMGNNGYGQEKRGEYDGENPGSNFGAGTAQGGVGAGLTGAESKQDGQGEPNIR